MADIFDAPFESKDIELSDNKVVKGEDVNLTAKDPTLTNIMVGIGWDLNAFDTDTLDLDVSCFLLNRDDKTRFDEDFIFYNNLQDRDEAVVHNGDNRTGAGDSDDETISIDLNKVPFDIVKVVFILSIYKGEEKEQTIASLRNSYIRVLNSSNSEELLRYEISEDIKEINDTAMFVASLNREGPKWHFEAVGTCADGGLAQVATDYDIIIHKG